MQNQARASDLPLYDIFAPQKISFQKFLMTSLHVICCLDPPIKNPGYAYGLNYGFLQQLREVEVIFETVDEKLIYGKCIQIALQNFRNPIDFAYNSP